MSADRDRDPTQRTNAPAGVLGGTGKAEPAPKPEGGEKRVPKSAFAHTIAGLQVPPAGAAHGDAATEAEPLRDPSERPAPTPYKRAHGAWGGTLPMPDPAPAEPGRASEQRLIAAKPTPSNAAQYIKPGATMAMPTVAEDPALHARLQAQRAPQAAPPSAQPPQQPVPKSMPTQALGSPATGHVISPAPPPPARSDRAPQAPKIAPAAAPRLEKGVEKTGPAPAADIQHSQPLSLSLHARDHLESAGPVAVPSSRTGLWIASALGVVVLVGILIWLFKPSDPPAPPVAVPTPPVAAPAAPAVAPEPLPGATPAPTTPPAQAVAPSAPEVTPPEAKPEAKPEPEKTASASRPSKPAAKKKKKVAPVKEAPVLQVKPQRSGEEEDDLEAAAEAAKRLSQPEAPPSPDDE